MANEKRLVDVNKIINSMQKALDENPDEKGSVAYIAFEVIIECLKEEPTVDAVEVVRCKDCKHWQESVDGVSKWCPLLMDKETKADDFCSYGERKEA